MTPFPFILSMTAGAEDVRYRPMTLVLAKEKSLEAVREALDARRTIGSYHGYLIGMFDLLEGLFACISTEKLSVVGKNTNWQLRNNSSLIFRFRIGNSDYILLPFTSCTLTRTSDITSVDVTVLNMYHYENTHPVFTLSLSSVDYTFFAISFLRTFALPMAR